MISSAAAPGSTPLTGLEYALCALSFFRGRHVWKERGSRRGLLVQNRIKDLSRSGKMKRASRAFVRRARVAGFRGSIILQVMSPNIQPIQTMEVAA